MSLREQAARGVVWSAAQTWGARAISFLITIILARFVLPDAFGLIAFATVFISFAQIFLDQGFGDAIVQCQQLEREHLDTAFWINLFTGSLLTIVGILISRPIEQLFNKPQLAAVLVFLSLNFLIGSLSSVQQAILKRQLAFKKLAVRSLIASLVSGAVAIILAMRGFGVWSLVAKMLVNSLVSVIVLWRVSDWRPSFNFSRKHLKELYRFGINILGSNFVEFFSRNADNFLIGFFLGTTILGYYTLAYNLLITMIALLIDVPVIVVFPTFSRLQDELTKMRQAFYEVTQLQSVVAFPIFVGTLALAPEAIIFLYGPNWAPSIPVTQVLMLIGILLSAAYFYGNVINAAGKPSLRFAILALTSVLNVIGFAIAVRWGIVAVAVSYVISGYISLPIYFLIIKRLINVNFRVHLQQYIPALCSSLAMCAIIFGLKLALPDEMELTLRILVLLPAGILTYLVTLYLIRPSLTHQVLNLIQLVLPGLKARTPGS